MKKFSKRLLATLLAVIMAIPTVLVLPFTASAVNDEDEYLQNHLVAQYFTDGSLTEDKIGNSNLEVVGTGASWVSEGIYNAAKFPGGSSGSNTNYYRAKLSDMLSTVSSTKGMSFSFTAKRGGNDYQRYFEVSSKGGYGDGGSTSYLYFSCNQNSKVKSIPYGNSESGSPSISDDGAWHQWTLTINKSTLFIYRDGVFSGRVEDTNRISDAWFNEIKNGYLLLGGSSITGDPLFSGSISNFKVYDVALTSLQVKYETSSRPTNHKDVNVRYKTAVNFHGTEGSDYAVSDNSYYFSPSDTAYGLTRYSSEHSINDDDNLRYFRMWNRNDRLYYSDSSSRTQGVFQDERDFRFDVTLGARLDSASSYLIAVSDRNGSLPIQLLKNGNLSINGNEITGIDSVYSGDNEKYHNNYTFSFDYSEQMLHFSCYGEYTDSNHNFAIERDVRVTDYGLNLNPGDLAGINILDGSGDGHVRFGGLFFYVPYATYSNNLAGLKKALSEYEKKITSGNIYTNASAAYEAYVLANRYIDAAEYGDRVFSEETYKAVIDNLISETTKMAEWIPRKGTAHGRFTGDNDYVSDADYAKTYSNVLYATEVTNDEAGATVWLPEMSIYENSEKCDPRLFHPVAVMMYDGETTPHLPIYSFFRHLCSAFHTYNIYYYAIFIAGNANGMEITNKWHGNQNESFNYQWNYLNNGEVNVDYKDTTDISDHKSVTFTFASGAWQMAYANIMKFTGSMADDEYSRTITPIWGMNFGNSGSDIRKLGVPGTKPLYVINYKALRDSLSRAAETTKSITSYKEGGLSEFFAAYDAATSFDPQTAYNWSDDTAQKVTDCGNKIRELVSNLDGSEKRTDTYPALRAEMKTAHTSPTGNSAKTDYDAGVAALNETYTSSSISAFRKAYKDSVREMYNLVESSYSSIPQTLTALESTHHSFAELADFTELDAAKDKALADYNLIDANMYTPASIAELAEYLENQFEFPYEYLADRKDTAVSLQSEIDAEAEKFENAQSAVLKLRTRLEYFDESYNKATSFLMSLKNAVPMYKADKVSEFIELVNSAEVQKYASQTEEDRAEYAVGGAEEAEANAIADNLNAALEELKASATEIDLSAYNQVITIAQSGEKDACDYPEAERKSDLSVATNSIKTTVDYNGVKLNVIKNNVSTALVDAVTSLVQSSLTTHLRKYSIEIVDGEVSEADGVTFNGGTHSYDSENDIYYATYNTKLNLKADEFAAWYMEFKSETTKRGVQYQASGKRYSTKVIGDIKVYVHNSSNGNRLTIARNYSDREVSPVQLVTFINGEYTLPNMPAISQYTFEGYTVNGNNYSAGEVINVTEDTDVYANYTLNEDLVYAVNVEGEAGVTKAYNDKITLEGNSDTFAWLELDTTGAVEKYKPFYIGKDITFFVTESITLKQVTEEEFEAAGYKLPAINIRQSGAYTAQSGDTQKVFFNGQFVTDSSFDIAEYGIVLGKANEGGSLTADDVILENIGTSEDYKISRFKSTKNVGANQFTIGVKGLSGDVIYKGYISYKSPSGSIVTVYTDPIIETL